MIKAITKGFEKLLDKRAIDPSLKPFLKGIIGALLKVMLVISVLTMLGIEMTSFVAILGAAGLAVWYGIVRNTSKFCWRSDVIDFQTI